MYGHPVKNVVWHHTDQYNPDRPAVIIRKGRRGVRRGTAALLVLFGMFVAAMSGFIAYETGRSRGEAAAMSEANRAIEQAVGTVQGQAREHLDACWEATQVAAQQTERLASLAEAIAAVDRSGDRLMIIDGALAAMAERVVEAQADVEAAVEACR